MVQAAVKPKNALHELGYKIFLDRYALKDMKRKTLQVGDLVIVVVNPQTGQREIGKVTALALPKVTIELLDGEVTERDIEHVDKPLETDPAQMMERVAKGIAAVEKSPKLRKQWAERFRWLLEDFKFVPAGRILTAAGTDQNLTFYNCMPPEQEILTAEGYKPLGEVRVGDLVVTHRNRLRPVLSKFERETEEPVYILKPRKLGFDDLRVTGDHKIHLIRSEWINKHRSRDGLRLAQQPDWIPAKDVRVGDFVAVAYNGEECPPELIQVIDYLPEGMYQVRDGKVFKATTRGAHGYVQDWGTHFDVNNSLALDEDLCYVLGRWLGDGCVTHRTKSDIPSGIKVVFALDEKAEADHIAEIITRKFNIPAVVKLSSTERWYDLWANSMPLGQFFKAFLGAYSYGKRIPDVLMHLPNPLTIALLRGLFSADGYISRNQLGIVLSNRVIATQVHQLLLKLGYLFSIKENTHRLGKHPAYRIQATANECGALFQAFFDRPAPAVETDTKHYVEYDGLRWVRIDEIALTDYSGIVMDIEVAEDHSFVSAGVVVSNCYVIDSPKDSRSGIIKTLSEMTEIMSRGGGVGINISSLRPRHSYVKGVNGRSSGSVSWGALYSFVTGLIEQGGSRRGALMLILNDWHPDVFDFINSKRQAGQITNANISVNVSDKLMAAIKADGDWELMFPDTGDAKYDSDWNGDLDGWRAKGGKVIKYRTVKAREVWNAIIESAWASAEPGLWFGERSNKESNSAYFNPLICTNPCVTGDTRISTDRGLIQARELFDSEQNVNVVVDGRFGHAETITPASRVILTGTKQVYRVQTREGYFVRATADHRIMTARGWVEVQDLHPGDRLHIVNCKGGFGTQGSLELGRVLGWTVGDGTVKKDQVVLSFFGEEKRDLAPMFAEYVNEMVEPLTIGVRNYPVGVTQVIERDEARVSSTRLHAIVSEHGLTTTKHRVPESVFQGSENMQRGFLQALFTADGSFQDGGAKGASVRLAANSMILLEQVQTLLLNFGIASHIYRNRRAAGYRQMPDANRELKAYWCEAQHELAISKRNMNVFADEIGFLMAYKQVKLEAYIQRGVRGTYQERFTATVESIVEDGIEEVFDLTEPLTHSFVGNNIVLHNCGEQSLGAYSVCNLGAINLARFYDEDAHDVNWDLLDTAVRYATRFLDNVIDATPYFFEENERVQKGERRVGLNNMGLAELLIKLELRYGSPESIPLIDKLYAFIARASYETSIELAQEKGAFPQFDGEQFVKSGFMQKMPADVRERVRKEGIRNVTLLTQAPNGTTGTLVNTSTGIEPFFSWKYYRKSRLGLHEENVPIAQEWLDAHPGETQLPAYFATAMDLAPEDHARVQAAIQRWVDSSISKTSNLPNNYTVEQVGKFYELLYDLGCKGGTVYRDGSRSEQVLMLKGDERAESEMKDNEKAKSAPAAQEQVATPHRVYPRPKKLTGVTVNTPTPYGTSYITMNSDENGYPFEVFITAPGKAGSDLQADAEGLGRMISLQLRTTAPQNRMTMLRLIIDQLQGIGGSRTVGFGPSRVMSLPDALAAALLEQYFSEEKVQQLDLFNASALPVTISASVESSAAPTPVASSGNGHHNANGAISGATLCPSCGTISLVRAEGCRKCLSCGYSEC
jgi:ribonucleoside-diphosphate reductase alpha chain